MRARTHAPARMRTHVRTCVHIMHSHVRMLMYVRNVGAFGRYEKALQDALSKQSQPEEKRSSRKLFGR